MNIGIIGSGGMSACLASKLVKLGHTVDIANSRGPASLRPFAEQIGAQAAIIPPSVMGPYAAFNTAISTVYGSRSK